MKGKEGAFQKGWEVDRQKTNGSSRNHFDSVTPGDWQSVVLTEVQK